LVVRHKFLQTCPKNVAEVSKTQTKAGRKTLWRDPIRGGGVIVK